ncbi:MAG: tRNA (adenosine(37)-N6)-threonylcarbamoyltransferase complex ATPase subunit type 1 TsaE [Gemmatales bacterium]|nr:tRNA (adenosine(37)-N6)-threonylcarbamoyltransferase complex ATPase subunit type 1 TsaE [Gemmatales bacterium]MDW8223499.1 tRNA (adenosine(37)-N6)-threonylcarbamoyltransferase complex ATPase subunit type 1 TsaE [Gemmatales bacterium]
MAAEAPLPEMTWQCEVANAAVTERLARELAERLFPGAVIGLIGELGAGKTFLVRSLADALGTPDSRLVSSPTFILIQEYDARLPVYHFDTYRLTRLRDFEDLGVHEYFRGDGVCLIEWADRVRSVLPPQRLEITFEITGPTSRRITLTARGTAYVEMLTSLQQAWASLDQDRPASNNAYRPSGAPPER